MAPNPEAIMCVCGFTDDDHIDFTAEYELYVVCPGAYDDVVKNFSAAIDRLRRNSFKELEEEVVQG